MPSVVLGYLTALVVAAAGPNTNEVRAEGDADSGGNLTTIRTLTTITSNRLVVDMEFCGRTWRCPLERTVLIEKGMQNTRYSMPSWLEMSGRGYLIINFFILVNRFSWIRWLEGKNTSARSGVSEPTIPVQDRGSRNQR
jgi:hypothetical protein